MRKYELTKIERKLKEVYFQYFTDYIIFSEQYHDLNEKGLLDIFIKSEYPYYLYEEIKKLDEHNIYPTSIIANLLEFLSIIEDRMQKILNEKQISTLNELIFDMRATLLNVINTDQTEIYYDEYIKRYSTMESNNRMMGISVKQLSLDIQKDFLYLDILMERGIEDIGQIGDDFYSFLQKLFIDFPEIQEYPYMLKNLKDILKQRNDAQAKEYLHLLSNQYRYKNKSGFCTDTVEVLYCNTLIKRFIFSNNYETLMKEVNPRVFYTVPFYYCLAIHLENYTKQNKIAVKEKEAYQNIISFMRENINKYAPKYRKDFTSLFNNWIRFFNLCQSEDISNGFYTREIFRDKKDLFLWIVSGEKKENDMKVEIDLEMSLCHELMKYFFCDESMLEEMKTDLSEGGKYTIKALDFLFYDYPCMFFDSTIYKRSIELLEKINVLDKQTNKQKEKMKVKLNCMRKDN